MLRKALLLCVLLLGTNYALAQERGAAAASATAAAMQEHGAAEAADAQPHPLISQDAWWVPIMITVIIALFLAAAVIGPIVRAVMPEEIPPAHGHDDHAAHGHDDHGHADHGAAHGH